MSRTDRGGSPRAIIHKRILDVAASRPDASLEAISEEVSGATTDLVERVLEEYGDPATDAQPIGEIAMKANGEEATEEGSSVDPASLTDRQQETLSLVHAHPEWSQADIADQLDVSRATVSRRLNDIPGFEWNDRREFTTLVFGESPESGDADSTTETISDDGTDTASSGDDAGVDAVGNGDLAAVNVEMADLTDRLERIETQVADIDAGSESADLAPELAHKVVHACMHSDRITEDEELRLIEALLGA